MTIHPEMTLFLNALFARCTTGYLTLTALPPTVGTVRSTPSRHLCLTDSPGLSDALHRLTISNQLGWGACVGIATRRANLGRYRRGARRDLYQIPALFVDIDQPAERWQARMDAFPLKPSIQVSSGQVGHCHMYWLLERPTSDFPSVDQILHGLAQWLGGDLVLTCAHGMRLPGTVNTKPDRHDAQCCLTTLDPERVYPLTEFAAYRAVPNPPQNLSVRYSGLEANHWTKTEYAELSRQVENCLLRNYDGFWQRNGWLAAYCPLPHQRDRPGQHFGFSPEQKQGHCFGKHGSLRLPELAAQLRLL